MTTTTADPERKASPTVAQHASIVETALETENDETNFTAMLRMLWRDARHGTHKQRTKAAELLLPLLAPHAGKIIDIEEAARAAGKKTVETPPAQSVITYVRDPTAALTPATRPRPATEEPDDEP